MKLQDILTMHFRLAEPQRAALARLGIATVEDLLYHFPFRHEQGGNEVSIAGLIPGTSVSIVGTLEKLETRRSWKRKIPVSEGALKDSTGKIKCMWFNQPYIAKMYLTGTLVKATGKVAGTGTKMYLANPELERVSASDIGLFKTQGGTSLASREESSLKQKPVEESDLIYQDTSGSARDNKLFAQYQESRGVTSLWFRHAIEKVLTSGVLARVEDPLPQEILKRYNLPTLVTALVWVHAPRAALDAEAARKRFAFEEVFYIQLARGREKMRAARGQSFAIKPPKKDIAAFVDSFPFTATIAQKRAIDAVLEDLGSGHAMSRLLEGDVGSGKTAVAATAAFAAVATWPAGQTFGTLQVAYMAPTEILAKQHFESFIQYFTHHPINIGLITGSGCYKFPSKAARGKATTISRAQLLKWVAGGEISVVIGTHALIQKSVQFKHLALVIIDEQHRFGTNQRRALARKDARLPHLLSMTATPIPRTLALTLYGDLDLTLLDEMPPGRKTIITEVVAPGERGKAYEKMRAELATGRQAYIVCPRIDEPDPQKAFALQAKSVKEEAKRLKKEVFLEYSIEVLHSKMKPKEKDAVMKKFLAHEIDILVATSVVEVGVNVPNATMIMVEGAERFGLSQLHQLRGRVVRSNHQAYCFVCPETRGEKTLARLKALTTAKNGFELAEMDLLQRGPGTLAGREQWGISDVGMEALKNLKLVEAARFEALALIQKDEPLARHPLLAEALHRRTQTMHFE
ncbi:ATP-dependent DNA helicase RecG [Patescibacteria group bacterium]|nr:ATP-dependent DNA helicase RecG [Patescibacteria group bacterium]